MTLQQLNAHIGKRIAELKNVKKIAFTDTKRDVIDIVIDELQELYDMSAVVQSQSSKPVKYADK